MSSKYKEYKLRVGLEIHFQLNTGRKLFCGCPVGMNKEIYGIEFTRRLRPTQSELGQIDPAAYFEFEKGLEIKYYAPDNLTCLVEMDEEPPHEPSKEAIRTALRIADFFKMYIVDEIHFMRKVVVDGSNTTGFQRTAIIGIDGHFYLNNKKYGVESICLEEEAARLIERRDNQVIYYLDRLGIPLVEISTSPDIESPEEAVKVAEYIGRVVQATGKRRHGIGSIRQDVNISIMGGNVVEVKGVQKLDTLKFVIEYEFERQIDLIRIKDILRERGITRKHIEEERYIDITEVFNNTKSKILKGIISSGGRVYGIRLPGFRGLLGFKLGGKVTFGKEFADRLRFWTGIKGLFHIDELPAYGISNDEVNAVIKKLNVDSLDSFIIIGCEASLADKAFEKIKERALEALLGVPHETRGAREDGTTFYLRPRPGMARMYPETDVPPIEVDEKLLSWVRENKLPNPKDIIMLLETKYGLSRDKAFQIFDDGLAELFMDLANKYGSRVSAGYISTLITEIPKSLQRDGYDISYLSDEIYSTILEKIYNGELAKENVPDILKILIKERKNIDEVISRFKLDMSIINEVKKYIHDLLRSRKDLHELPYEILRKRLIGIIMSKYRGKIDPSEVIKLVNEAIKK